MLNGHIDDPIGDISADFEADDRFLAPDHVPLPELTARINAKVQRFLRLQPKDKQARRVQEQTKVSLNVIKEALDRYEYVLFYLCEYDHALSPPVSQNCLCLITEEKIVSSYLYSTSPL
jgi:hypothetical protein